MKGIILAAGEGKRLHPLTRYVSKALLPICGRPAIEQVVESFRDLGISEIAIVIGHLGEQIRDFLGDGSRYSVGLSYKVQEKPLGTANALLAAKDFITEDVLVAATDCLLPLPHLKQLLARHNQEECDATLSLKRLSRKEILSSATILCDSSWNILKIIEKPAPKEILSEVASSPYYLFIDVIKDYLPRVRPSGRGEYELADAIQMMIDDGLRVKGILSNEWKHLSDIDDFLRLNFPYLKFDRGRR